MRTGAVDDEAGRDGQPAIAPLLLQAAIEACPVNISIADMARPGAPLIYVNRAFCETTGFARGEALGRNCRFLQGEQTDPAAVARIRRALENREAHTAEIVNYRRCGTAFLNRLELAPVSDRSCGIDAYVGIQRDITAFRAAEASRQQREKLESLGQLAAGLAHELNNLLQPIIIYGDLLALRGADQPQAAEQLATLRSCARAARDLTARVLQFTRRSTAPEAALPAAERLGEALRLAERILPPGVRLVVVGVPDLTQPCTIPAGELVQVFGNLFKNAADAMGGAGTLTVRGAVEGGLLRLSVSDTGPGIPPDLLGRIFDPFFTTKAPGAGTGLGLAAVWNLVRSWTGTITVESAPGRETTFTLAFPPDPPPPWREENP